LQGAVDIATKAGRVEPDQYILLTARLGCTDENVRFAVPSQLGGDAEEQVLYSELQTP